MNKVLCFGEILLRMSPQLDGAWINNASMPVYLGGSELNTANALSLWGVPVVYCSALPDHALSKDILAALHKKNIDTSRMIIQGNRIGCYYLPQGTDLKHAAVIYDRAHSSFSELRPGQIDWEVFFENVTWFHFSAISPALNENIAVICAEAASFAHKKGITVSIDLNYRSRLWQYGKQPYEIIPGLAQYCDVIMGNIWAMERMLQVPVRKNIKHHKREFLDQSLETSVLIAAQYPNCRYIANTFRFDESRGLTYYTTLYDRNKMYQSEEYYTENIIDRVGTGDCFMAGLIYGMLCEQSSEEIIQFATAAAYQKLFIMGDGTTSTIDDVKRSYIKHAE